MNSLKGTQEKREKMLEQIYETQIKKLEAKVKELEEHKSEIDSKNEQKVMSQANQAKKRKESTSLS